VNSNISGKDLIAKVQEMLLPPLKTFCGEIPFNIHEMMLRETGGGLWLRVNVTDAPHFGTRFLKPPPRKKDAMPIFTAPTKPPVFGFFFEEKVWDAIQHRANVCAQFQRVFDIETYIHQGYPTYPTAPPTEALPSQVSFHWQPFY
jgi:hypothetical protein